MITVYAIKLIKNLKITCLLDKLTFLSNESVKQIKKFINPDDAQRTLLGELMVRDIVFRKFKKNNKDFFLKIAEHGKPYLANNRNFHFNISHSGEWVVCAVSELEVGIDVELINPIDMNIARRFFSEEEKNLLFLKCGEERLAYFFELWTLKESYLKAVGKGLTVPLKSFTIIKTKNGIEIKNCNTLDEYNFKQYNISCNYKMAVCGIEKEFSNEVIIIDSKKLISSFGHVGKLSFRGKTEKS